VCYIKVVFSRRRRQRAADMRRGLAGADDAPAEAETALNEVQFKPPTVCMTAAIGTLR
jgi:hypothetical protein